MPDLSVIAPIDIIKVRESIEYHVSTIDPAILESADPAGAACLLRVVADCIEVHVDKLNAAAERLESYNARRVAL